LNAIFPPKIANFGGFFSSRVEIAPFLLIFAAESTKMIAKSCYCIGQRPGVWRRCG
jgi:hypothetical protein